MNLMWKKFEEGNTSGISIYTTEEYFKVYEKGNTDPEMISDMINEGLNNKVLFDVGAFIGLSSLVFSKYSENCKIIAFEPNIFNVERIKKNFSKNKQLAKQIQLYNYAISNKKETIKMYLSSIIEGPSSTSRISGSHSTIQNEDLPNCFEYNNVEAITLDDFSEENSLIPDIIKIDIEGAEYLLLLGAKKVLNKYHPLLYIEFHSEYCSYKCTELLINLGYTISLLKEEKDNRIIVKAKYGKILPSDFNKNIIEFNYMNFLNIIQIQEKILKNIELLSNENFKKNDIIKDLESKNTSYKNKIEVLSKENFEKNDIIKDLESKNTSYKSTINNYKQLLTKANNLSEEMSNELLKIKSSKSWKVTKPLRSVLFKIRRK